MKENRGGVASYASKRRADGAAAATPKGVAAYTLKWIAVVTMAVDHTGVMLGDVYGWGGWYWIMRYIGRIAFPIFAFQLIEGFYHTRARLIYLRNLLIFAAVSELPFDLLFHGWARRAEGMSIFCTLSLALLGMIASEEILRRCQKGHYVRLITVPCSLLPMAGMVALGDWLRVDYGGWGVLLIAAVYYAEKFSAGVPGWIRNPRLMRNTLASCAILGWMLFYDWSHGWRIESYGVLALLPILLYNGERGRSRLSKWFFYGFYPAHILLLFGIKLLLLQARPR